MTKRTRTAWGRPATEVKRDAFKRPIVEKTVKNAWGREVRETVRNAWGRVITDQPKRLSQMGQSDPRPETVTSTTAGRADHRPSVERPAAGLVREGRRTMEIRESARASFVRIGG